MTNMRSGWRFSSCPTRLSSNLTSRENREIDQSIVLAVWACELVPENLLHKPGVVACREDFVHSLQLCDALQPCEGSLSCMEVVD